MFTLGINAAFHDQAACLVKDGMVVAAVEEERFTHVKHGKRPLPFTAWELPYHAIDYCLGEADITIEAVDHIAYSFDPVLVSLNLSSDASFYGMWDLHFMSTISAAPRLLVELVPHHLRERLRGQHRFRWHFVNHHLAHAASAFLCSPYREATVAVVDGRGELASTSYWYGLGTELRPYGEVLMPNSLGLMYEEVTDFLGFLRSSDEYKVMAMASFGEPAFIEFFREMITVGKDGQYDIRPLLLDKRFGPKRQRGAELKKRHYDLARSVQVALEETVLKLVDDVWERTGTNNLCLAGGVALNCVMNARLRDESRYRNVWVQPAAGDAGTALGAALLVDVQERQERPWVMDHAFLGPAYGDKEIKNFLDWTGVPYLRLPDVAEHTAKLLAEDRVVGWCQGRMEFGPRALGARSILASPIRAEMQARLNDIKDREDFRPVAPVVLEEEAANWFTCRYGSPVSPFMLFVYGVVEDKADKIPAVRHADGTARIQTINRKQNSLYYDLLRAFQRRTGVPVLVNTSFNTRGEPIVCTVRDAVESFWTSPLDALVIGSFLLQKRA